MSLPTKDQIGLGAAVSSGYGPTQNRPPASATLELFVWFDPGVSQFSQIQNGVWMAVAAPAPFYIPADSCFFVPPNTLSIWTQIIDTDEATTVVLDISGALTEV